MALPLKDLPKGASPGFGKSGYLSRSVESPALELAYTEFTSNVTITATAEASATTIVTAPSLDLDGQAILVEFFCARVYAPDAESVVITLWDGTTDLGRLTLIYNAGTTETNWPVHLARKIATPTVGSHTYSVRAWHEGVTDAIAYSGAGGSGSLLPGFVRITRCYTQSAAR